MCVQQWIKLQFLLNTLQFILVSFAAEKVLQMPSSHSFCNEYFSQFVFICRFSCALSLDSVHSFASSKCKFKRNFAHSLSNDEEEFRFLSIFLSLVVPFSVYYHSKFLFLCSFICYGNS